MKLMGFNFKKISVEKLGERPKELKINTNIDITEIKNLKSDLLKTKEEILAVDFSYTIDYSSSFATLNFEGTLLIATEPKISKDLLKQWKKKKIPEEFRIPIFNIILMKSNIKALALEDEMNLPLHIPLPTLKPGQEK